MQENHTDVIILGGGLGGLEVFRSLKKRFRKNNINKKITILDQNNHFTFTPLLHEVSSGAVDPSHATLPFRELTYKSPHDFRQCRVEKIKPKEKEVKTSVGKFSYDRCIIGLGSNIDFCGLEGAQQHTHHVRRLKDALKLKNTVLKKLEQNPDTLQINIVGGGYTGVELAGEFGHLKQDDFKKLYPKTNIVIKILEVGDSILSNMNDKVQQKVEKRLLNLGVEIETNICVEKVNSEYIISSNEKEIKNDITIWATGFACEADNYLNEQFLQENRIPVNNQLQHPKDDSLYALGDIALITDPKTNKYYPQLGEAAHKEGEFLAKKIAAEIQGKETISPFSFQSKGRLMPVGEWYGVAVFKHFTLFGKLAWWMRRTAYVLYMPGLIKKLRLIVDWTFDSFGFRNLTKIDVDNYN